MLIKYQIRRRLSIEGQNQIVEAQSEAWTRKRALEEVKQILGNKEKEVVWLNKMEVLHDKRRTRKQIQSIGKNDFT